jgi:hypothetical protein
MTHNTLELLKMLEPLSIPFTAPRKMKGSGIKFCFTCRKHVTEDHDHRKKSMPTTPVAVESKNNQIRVLSNRYSTRKTDTEIQHIDDSFIVEHNDGTAHYMVCSVVGPSETEEHSDLTIDQLASIKTAVRLKKTTRGLTHIWLEDFEVLRPHQSDIWKLADLVQSFGGSGWFVETA